MYSFVRRDWIIGPFYSSSIIEEANKNDIDELNKEDEFDIFRQYTKEWIGGDGITKTVASPNICINKWDKKQAERVGEEITKRRAK